MEVCNYDLCEGCQKREEENSSKDFDTDKIYYYFEAEENITFYIPEEDTLVEKKDFVISPNNEKLLLYVNNERSDKAPVTIYDKGDCEDSRNHFDLDANGKSYKKLILNQAFKI